MKLTCTLVDDREDDRLYRVDAEPPQAPQFCAKCGERSETCLLVKGDDGG